MKHVSIQLDTAIARQIEKDMKEFNYSTKTEFIRDSIRDKLKQLSEEREKKKDI
jgi:Arc/MetJ-type ribon-helix-helix transcriptional regulator